MWISSIRKAFKASKLQTCCSNFSFFLAQFRQEPLDCYLPGSFSNVGVRRLSDGLFRLSAFIHELEPTSVVPLLTPETPQLAIPTGSRGVHIRRSPVQTEPHHASVSQWTGSKPCQHHSSWENTNQYHQLWRVVMFYVCWTGIEGHSVARQVAQYGFPLIRSQCFWERSYFSCGTLSALIGRWNDQAKKATFVLELDFCWYFPLGFYVDW